MKPVYWMLVLWNLLTFALMGLDKYRARHKMRRISERALFACAFFMGGVGAETGMVVFRHKTRHKKFVIGLPLCILANLIILYVLLNIIK